MSATTSPRPIRRSTPVASAVSSEFGTGWQLYLFLLLYALTLPTLKVPLAVHMRIGQLILIAGFGVLALRDLISGRARWGVLLVLVGCGFLLCAISAAVPFPKFGQTTFFIKYLFLYPPAFYLGARLMAGLPAARLALILELVLLSACVLALLLNAHPVPLLIHERPEVAAEGLKGSFWEQGAFAFFIGLFLLASVALRAGYHAWPRRTWLLPPLYLLAIGCAAAAGSLAVWVGLLVALTLAGLLYRPPGVDFRVARRWGLRLLIAAAIAVAILWLYNHYLPAGEKLLTLDRLQMKWQTERGAALRAAWGMIQERPWLGHGFGYIEAYFSTHAAGIVGLGSGVALLFNSYINLWVSVGLAGLIYGLALVWVVFDRRVLFTAFVVVFLFVSANISPVAQTEYYYLFLGCAFALSRWYGPTRSPTYIPEERFDAASKPASHDGDFRGQSWSRPPGSPASAGHGTALGYPAAVGHRHGQHPGNPAVSRQRVQFPGTRHQQ